MYFYHGGKRAAAFVAEVAEQARDRVSKGWQYRLRDRITILLYNSHNDFEQTNLNLAPAEESVGGFTEFYKNRVVIPFEGSYEQLRHVTHHELTHAILLQMLFGTGAFSIATGISRANIPLWFIEGLAEYESRGGWDYESDMFLRDAVISGYLPPIRYLSGFLAYKGGQSVLAFIAHTYGGEKIGELLGKLRLYKDIDKAVQASLGMNLDELSRDWQKYLRRRYWPEYRIRREPQEFARQLTSHVEERNFINNSGSLSPNADRVAYLSNRSGFFDIYLASARTGQPLAKLVSGQKSGRMEELHWLRPGITWSPDGRYLAFAAKDRARDVLHLVDVAKRKVVRSISFDLDGLFSPDWSADGSKIAFAGSRAGASDIYVVDLDTGGLRNLTNDIFSDLAPRWSPDGNEIAFVSDRGEHLAGVAVPDGFSICRIDYRQHDVYSIDVASGRIARVTATAANEKSPAWFPDGSGLAFVSDRSGISNIYLKRQRAAEPPDRVLVASIGRGSGEGTTEAAVSPRWRNAAYPITNVLTGVDHLSWRDQRLVFTSFNNGGFDLFCMTRPLDVGRGAIRLQTGARGRELALDTAPAESAAAPRALRDTSASGRFRNFVFGKAFRSGRPLGEFSTQQGPFLRPEACRNDQGEFKVSRYRTRFSADLITADAGFDPFFGFQGATLVSFSDLMGNQRFNFMTDIFIDYKNSDFALSYQYRPRQTDYGVGIYEKNNLFLSNGRFLVRDRNFGIQLQMNRPFDRYRRLSYGFDFKYIRRHGLVDFAENARSLANSSTKVALFSLAYVKDNVIWGFTGPRAGTRYNISVQASPDLGAGGLDFRIYQFDYRHYINFARRVTYAMHISGGLSEGRQRQRFFLGGMPNWINLKFRQDVSLDLDEVYFSNFVMPLRGYDYYERIGSKYLVTNFELRMPFVDYFQSRWPMPLRLANIRGALFVDLGGAWDGRFNPLTKTPSGHVRLDDLLMSFGWGGRVNLGIFLLKYDMAWRTDLTGVSRLRNLISIGADF